MRWFCETTVAGSPLRSVLAWLLPTSRAGKMAAGGLLRPGQAVVPERIMRPFSRPWRAGFAGKTSPLLAIVLAGRCREVNMPLSIQILGAAGRDNALLVTVDSGQAVTRLLFDCGDGCLWQLPFGAIQEIDHLC